MIVEKSFAWSLLTMKEHTKAVCFECLFLYWENYSRIHFVFLRIDKRKKTILWENVTVVSGLFATVWYIDQPHDRRLQTRTTMVTLKSSLSEKGSFKGHCHPSHSMSYYERRVHPHRVLPHRGPWPNGRPKRLLRSAFMFCTNWIFTFFLHLNIF